MAKDLVMLAKYLKDVKPKDLDKMFPMELTEKLDGIMAEVYFEDGKAKMRTRQGEPITCAEHILEGFNNDTFKEDVHFIGELWCDLGIEDPDEHFNVLSGKIRQGKPFPEVYLHLFDCYSENAPEESYFERKMQLCTMHNDYVFPLGVKIVPFIQIVENKNELYASYKVFMGGHPKAEGVVCRPMFGEVSYYKKGRSWGFLKKIPEYSVDLPIKRIVEGSGNAQGSAGAVIVDYKGKELQVGLGSIKHDERESMWLAPEKYIGQIVEIAYKNETYQGMLRMPRVKAIRWDKS